MKKITVPQSAKVHLFNSSSTLFRLQITILFNSLGQKKGKRAIRISQVADKMMLDFLKNVNFVPGKEKVVTLK